MLWIDGMGYGGMGYDMEGWDMIQYGWDMIQYGWMGYNMVNYPTTSFTTDYTVPTNSTQKLPTFYSVVVSVCKGYCSHRCAHAMRYIYKYSVWLCAASVPLPPTVMRTNSGPGADSTSTSFPSSVSASSIPFSSDGTTRAPRPVARRSQTCRLA